MECAGSARDAASPVILFLYAYCSFCRCRQVDAFRSSAASFPFHDPGHCVPRFSSSCSAMIHPKIVRDGPMKLSGPDPLQDALELRARIRGLKALLDLQRWQIEVLTDKLYSSEPGGTAARRLLALKHSETRASRASGTEKP
jgi:hypothetical protein